MVLLERREQVQRQLRLQEEEAAAARAISAQAREAYLEREAASKRLKKAAEERESRRYFTRGVWYRYWRLLTSRFDGKFASHDLATIVGLYRADEVDHHESKLAASTVQALGHVTETALWANAGEEMCEVNIPIT